MLSRRFFRKLLRHSLCLAAGLLAFAALAPAEETETFQPGDVLYAPEEMSPTASTAPAGLRRTDVNER